MLRLSASDKFTFPCGGVNSLKGCCSQIENYLIPGRGVSGSRLRVQGSRFRVHDFGFRVEDLGFRVWC